MTESTTAERLHWTAEENGNFEPPWIIRYDPTPNGRKNEDGSISYSLRFPALQVMEYVAKPDAVAHEIARKLNAHDDLVEALSKTIIAIDAYAAVSGKSDIGLVTAVRDAKATLNSARAALAKASGEQP